MPPSTKAERAAAVEKAKELRADVESAEQEALKRREKLEDHIAHMIDVMAMTRREIGELVGAAHNTVRTWYGNHHKRMYP